MKNSHNYVECHSCKWLLENVFTYDWGKYPCLICDNTRIVIDPKEILCNLCGECMCPIGTMNEQYPHGLYNAEVSGSYDSYYLLDMTRYTFNFCEKCLRELFVQCKIKPIIECINLDNELIKENSWEFDHASFEYQIWRDNGGAHQAYLNKKCNSKKDCQNDAIYTCFINDVFTEECACEEHKAKDGGSYKSVKFICNELKPYL